MAKGRFIPMQKPELRKHHDQWLSSQEVNLNWTLTDPQHKFISSDAKYRLFSGGIGSGKSATGWIATVIHVLNNPGCFGAVVVPTYPMLRDVILREMYKWLKPEMIKGEYNETKKELTLINGSTIIFRTADNPRSIERLRGPTMSWFWIDEITLLTKTVFDIMIGRLRQPGYELRGWMTGTPKMNWVYDHFIKNEMPDCFVIKDISTHSNIFNPKGYVESLEKLYTGNFYEQEILGKFVSFEGLIFHIEPYQIITDIQLKSLTNNTFYNIVYGVDFGFRNPSAISVIGEHGGRFYLLDEFYQRNVHDDELIGILQNKMDYWGVGKVVCDPSAPASIDKFRREGIDAVKANNDVQSGIRRVSSLIDTKRFFVCDRCQNFLNEVNSYSWDDKKTKEQPIKLNDHMCDAVRYSMFEISDASRESVPIDYAAVGGFSGFGGLIDDADTDLPTI